jgi:hypothetical protein
MLLQGAHHRQSYILAPVLSHDLYTDWQTDAVFLYLASRTLGEVSTMRTVAFLALPHPGGSDHPCGHT